MTYLATGGMPFCRKLQKLTGYHPLSLLLYCSGSSIHIWTSATWIQLFTISVIYKGIADSPHKTYQSALCRFGSFCSLYSIVSPFPVSESLLCYYASYLATQRLAPQTIKTYLAAIRYMQVILGLPEPREFSSLPRLRLVQSGIQRTHLQRTSSPPRV